MSQRKQLQKNTGNIMRQELAENRNVLGDFHPETVKSYQKLIHYLLNELQFSECLELVSMEIILYEKELDATLKDKASGQQKQKLTQLMKIYQEISDIQMKIYEVQQTCNDIRLESINRLLQYQKLVYSEDSQQYTISLQKKARILLNKNDKLSSMSCLEQCLNIQNKIMAKNNLGFGETYMMIGQILQEYGLFEEALTHYYLALNLYEGQPNKENIQLAHVRVQISTILYHQNKRIDSLELLSEAFTIYNQINLQKLSAKDLQLYSSGLYQYSVNLRDQGFFEKALQYANLDYQIKLQNKLDTQETCENLGQIHYLKGDIKKSKEFFEIVLRQAKSNFDRDPTNSKYLKHYINLLNQLLLISQILDENTEALRYQKTKEQILMKINFQKAKKKTQNSHQSLPFKQSVKQLDSFPSFNSLQTTRLPSISNFQEEMSPKKINNISKQSQIVYRHSLSNVNFQEHPASAILFNRSMSVLVQTNPKTPISKQQFLQNYKLSQKK